MNPTCSLRRAAALGFFVLPVFCDLAPRAMAADAFITTSGTYATRITGSAYIGAASATATTFTSPTVVFASNVSVGSGVIVDGGSLLFPVGATNGGSVLVNHSGSFTMTGGTVGYGKMYDGTININGSGSAAISMSGGTLIGDLGSSGGTVALSGGTVEGQLVANPTSVITFSGGAVQSGLGVYSGATLNLTGSGLTVLSSSYSAPYTVYSVSGMLTHNSQTQAVTYSVFAQDGSNFEFNGHSVSGAASTPAPGSLTVSLLGCAGMGFGLMRRRRR